MTIQAYERGRNLIIDLGDESDEGFIRLTVKPVAAKVGAALQALHAGIAFAQSEDVERDAVLMGKLAVGEENWPTVDDELRWAEAEAVIHAAFFWNVQGGGIDLVNMVLNRELGGHPKAMSTLMERNGLSKAFELLRTLLDGGEDAATPSPVATSGTSTPSGSES